MNFLTPHGDRRIEQMNCPIDIHFGVKARVLDARPDPCHRRQVDYRIRSHVVDQPGDRRALADVDLPKFELAFIQQTLPQVSLLHVAGVELREVINPNDPATVVYQPLTEVGTDEASCARNNDCICHSLNRLRSVEVAER